MSYEITDEDQWENRDIEGKYCSGCPNFTQGTNYLITSRSEEPNQPDECGGSPDHCIRWIADLDL